MTAPDSRAGHESGRLIHLLSELKEAETLAEVQRLLARGGDPLAIVESCQEGMRHVGEFYEKGRYFISGLIMAGEILRQVVEMLLPVIRARIHSASSGRIIIGTVAGDIHDIGKGLVTMLLECYGFEVLDLGVDVPPHEFVSRSLDFNPDIVAMSALLTTSHEAMKETVALIQTDRQLEGVNLRTIIGGGFIDDKVCRYVGADFWARDAMTGLRYCQNPGPG